MSKNEWEWHAHDMESYMVIHEHCLVVTQILWQENSNWLTHVKRKIFFYFLVKIWVNKILSSYHYFNAFYCHIIRNNMSWCEYAYTMSFDQGFRIVVWMSLGFSLVYKMAIRGVTYYHEKGWFVSTTPNMGERELWHTSVPLIHHEQKPLNSLPFKGCFF